jgi:CO/xanthine dehydrogenase Mo-binding subunit
MKLRHESKLVVNGKNTELVLDSRARYVIMAPEEDSLVNPLGVKGIGEIGIVGMNAAVANAVYHATGKRIRELPIRPEKPP